MPKKFPSLLKLEYLGLYALTIILFLITYNSVKIDFFLIGWDNFSTSLEPQINFGRTLFATWRAYRGMGSASDSEVVDIFRQLFQFIVIFLTGKPTLADQIYNLTILWLGTFGMYRLALECFANYKNKNLIHFGATVASLFYLFNLNTLATFFYPMPMFVTRFAFFPWIIWTFIHVINQKQIRRRDILVFSLITFLGSTSYLTATIFITISWLLGIIALTSPKKIIFNSLWLFYFGVINLFWLLPFLNYSLEKAEIVPQASTYIEVNEIQLNESPGHFYWEKILTLYPSFFYTYASDLETSQKIPLHPKLEWYNKLIENKALLFFPFAYILGSVFILFKIKDSRTRWIPFVVFFSILLLRKEYPPFGFIYDWLGEVVPYFKIIFRFGDTKFHPLLATSGSLAAAGLFVIILNILSKLSIKLISVVLTILLIAGNVYMFSSYFSGLFFSDLMYNQIPQPYFEIAEIINQDTSNGRVVHLPIEISSYWKPYNWGYVGSTFFAYMINKPLIERTFEPASLENDKINQNIINLVKNADKIKSPEELNQVGQEFHRMLQKSNTKYLIFDETVIADILSRKNRFWGTFYLEGTKQVVMTMESLGLIEKIYSQKPTLKNFNSVLHASESNTGPITLYQIKDEKPIVQSLSSGVWIDNQHDNLIKRPFYYTSLNQLQSENHPGSIFPFQLENNILEDFKNDLILKIETGKNKYSLGYDPKIPLSKHPFEVYLRQDETNIYLSLKHIAVPEIDYESPTNQILVIPKTNLNLTETQYHPIASDWHILPTDKLTQYRLRIDNVILPLPADISTSETYFTTVLLSNSNVQIDILSPSRVNILPLDQLGFTSDPNCFKDKQEGYEYSLNFQSGLQVSTKLGTTCLTAPHFFEEGEIYVESELDFSVKASEETYLPPLKTPSQLQQNLYSEIIKKPVATYINFCMLENSSANCLNNHQTLKNRNNFNNVLVPSNTITSDKTQIWISIPSINDSQITTTFRNIKIINFQSIFSATLQTNPVYQPQILDLTNKEFVLRIPKLISRFSYYFNPETDGIRVYNQPCEETDGYRTTRNVNAYILLYSQKCQSGAYISVPFSSDNYYFWKVDYHLFSGKFPKFVIADAQFNYSDQFVSLKQGYPNIPEFKNLQVADPFPPTEENFDNMINESFLNPVFKKSYKFILPDGGLDDNADKTITFYHQSENQGISALKSFDFIELPSAWSNFHITPNNNFTQFDHILIDTTKQLIPSIWKISATQTSNSFDKSLLSFGQAYDDQWKLYQTNSVIKALLGMISEQKNHIKIDGLSNGWIIDSMEIGDQTTFIALYTPERLAIVGTILSGITLSIGFLIAHFLRKRRKNKS